MVQIKNFSESLERDLSKLQNEVVVQRSAHEGMKMPEREIVKKSFEAYAEKAVSAAPASASPVSPVSSAPAAGILPSYLEHEEGSEKAKQEVERLVALVFSDGLEAGVREARKLPPFIEDAFHDALVDKLMPELRRRGIVT